MRCRGAILVNLASGIGNIVLATPLVLSLARHGFIVDLLVDADYHGVEALFDGWDAVRHVYVGPGDSSAIALYEHVAAAIPPFYWRRFRSRYEGLNVYRPPDALFYENEQAYYLQFARALGCDVSNPPTYYLPARNVQRTETIVLAPGSKPVEMATKRWPYYAELAAQLGDVTFVGTADDLLRFDRSRMQVPGNVHSVVGCLSLGDTVSLLASARAVVANDSGLGHVAGALGTPTILLFGPTPNSTLGVLPQNVTVLRSGLPCEPCWFGARFRACSHQIDCLRQLSIKSVIREIDLLTSGASIATA